MAWGKGTLYYWGNISAGFAALEKPLSERRVPQGLVGNFAWVYIEKMQGNQRPWSVAMVDHLSSLPLFISDTAISYHFSTLVADFSARHPDFACDRHFFWESQLLWGFTVSRRTIVKGIERVRSCSVWIDGEQRQQLDLNNFMGEEPLTPQRLREEILATLSAGIKPVTAALVSGGTDSATLLAAVAVLGIKDQVRFVSFHSPDEINNETAMLERLRKKLALEVTFFESPSLDVKLGVLPKAGEPFAPSNCFFWHDYSFYFRREAIVGVDKGDVVQGMSGECGDQLFGGPKTSKHMAFATQSSSWSARDIARQYIHLCMRESMLEWQGVKYSPLVEWYKQLDPIALEVYEDMIAHIAIIFESFQTNDLLNRFLNLNLLLKGRYRLFHYSQDAYDFFHPFAEWNLVSLALRSRSCDKIFSGGRLKEICYRAFEQELIEEIWNAPKTGNTVPILRTVSP